MKSRSTCVRSRLCLCWGPFISSRRNLDAQASSASFNSISIYVAPIHKRLPRDTWRGTNLCWTLNINWCGYFYLSCVPCLSETRTRGCTEQKDSLWRYIKHTNNVYMKLHMVSIAPMLTVVVLHIVGVLRNITLMWTGMSGWWRGCSMVQHWLKQIGNEGTCVSSHSVGMYQQPNSQYVRDC